MILAKIVLKQQNPRDNAPLRKRQQGLILQENKRILKWRPFWNKV